MLNKWVAGICSIGVAIGAAGLSTSAASAQELSEQTVRWWMNMAWSNMPARFTGPDGEIIIIDKKAKDQTVVPMETAREILVVAQRSYRAQICNLAQEQSENYASLVARQNKANKWSKQQGVYMMMLHLTVVQLMAGKVKAVQKEGDNVVLEENLESKSIKPCTDDERQKLKQSIAAFVASGPPLPAAPPTTTGSTTAPATATAAPAAAKK